MHQRARFFNEPQLKLSEANAPESRVQIIRTGKFKHEEYGTFSITKDHLDAFVKNFSENVRRVDLAIDFGHDSGDIAAGWIKSLSVEADPQTQGAYALLAEVDWTPAGIEKLQGKLFRYLSADFTLAYTDSETGKQHGPVLFGAGLTNRPFVRGQQPVVTLSENEKGDTGMTLEQALEKIKKLEADLAAARADNQELSSKKKDEEKEKELSELKLKLSEHEKDAEKRKADQKLSEKKAKFDKMLSEKKVVEAQRKPYMDDDFAAFSEAAQPEVKTDRKTKDGEGAEEEEPSTADEADAALESQATKLQAEQKLSYIDAQAKVLADPANKKLLELAGR